MDIVVVGGGASGVICSILAKRDNNRVILLERNNILLKKLLMTGNGRCNYMNELYGTKYYHSMDIDLVDEIISSMNIELIRDFFDRIGIVSKNKNGYYYPYSNQAISVKNALVHELESVGVEVVFDCLVEDINKNNDKFIINTNLGEYISDKVVISTGSYSYPKTGSDGMGYSFLEKFGHSIVKPVPALVQLVSDFKYLKEWDGVRSDVKLELFEDGKFISSEEGEVQLTSYGLSGICTFNLSHDVSRGLIDNKEYEIHINFVPFIETLVTPWLDNYSKKCSTKNISELLEGFLNYKVVNVLLKVCGINKDVYYKDLDKNKKFLLCKYLRSFPIKIIGTKDFNHSQICNGGVRLNEIILNTFESKKVDGLYITGELLDVNGNCGGYNLSICWISGMLAGESLGELND